VAIAGDGNISLRWSENAEADLGGYRVYYGTSSGVYGAPIDVGNQTTHLLSGLTNGTTYFIVITAYDNSPNRNESGNSIEVSARPQADLPPAPPTGLVAVARDGAVDLAWNTNAEPDLGGYIVHRGASAGNYTAHTVVGNVSVYHVVGLVNGQQYFFAVTAYDQADHQSGYSNEVNAQPALDPDVTPPLRPENLSAQPGSSLVDLYWSANLEPDLASYNLYWGTSSGVYPNVVNNITQPSRRVSGLTDGTLYFFAVSAVDTAGNESEKSIERSAVPNGTVPDTTPPAPPVNLVALPGNQKINLSWSANIEADFSHYNIRFGTAPGVYGAPINGGTATTYQINNLVNGTIYYIVLTAVDISANESGYSSEVTAAPQAGGGDTTPPAPPTGLVAAAGDGFVDLQWVANGEADLWGYNLYVGTSSGAYGTPLNLGDRTSFQVDGLVNGTEYFFALTAYDSSGNESGYSAEVTAVPVVGAGGSGPDMPTGFIGEIVGGNIASLSWNPNTDTIAGYNLSWGTTLGDYTGHAVLGNLTSQTLGLDIGVTYYFIVQSRDWDGNLSAPAGPISLTAP
jgi:fibronectin type 3 domain-containing protein